MAKIKCKVSYRSLKTTRISVFAIGVRDGIFTNPTTFMTPPEPVAAFELVIDEYEDTYAAYKAHTASKDDVEIKRTALVAKLDIFSTYVDVVADGNAAIIGLSGFIATKGSASTVLPPVQPIGVTLVRGSSRELIAECPAVAGVIFNGAVLTAGEMPADVFINGDGQIVANDDASATPGSASSGVKYVLDLNKGRKKKFTNLTIGVTYYVYFWASNAAGVSILSEGVSKNVLE
jgi:hypothetical protein